MPSFPMFKNFVNAIKRMAGNSNSQPNEQPSRPGQAAESTQSSYSNITTTDQAQVGDSTEEEDIPKGFVICNRFQILEKIGRGGFGDVYKAQDLSYGLKSYVAIKVSRGNEDSVSAKQLEHESKVLEDFRDVEGFPQLKWFGVIIFRGNTYKAMAMELLGVSLQDLIYTFKRFTLPTVLLLGIQILHRLEKLHSRNYVHRDIKPDNLVMGVGGGQEAALVYMVDFGLAKPYQNAKKEHIPEATLGWLVGTVRYASINAHLGKELSRRDDLESVGYMLIHFLKGGLPWKKIEESDKLAREKACGDKKRDTPLKKLCDGLPVTFLEYMKYCRKLQFTEMPDYEMLRQKFYSLYHLCYGTQEIRFDFHQ